MTDGADFVLVRWPQALAGALSRATGTDVVTAITTSEPVVALTFDDGPHPATTPHLLDVLAAAGARATFFVLGSLADRHPQLIERIAGEGHELGNHLMHDEPSIRLHPADFERQLAQVHALLTPHGPVRFFRPGSGWFSPRLLRAGAALGYRCALGSPGLIAAFYPNPDAVGLRLARRARPGAVLVLHEGTDRRSDVTRVTKRLLTELTRRGLTATTLSDLSGRGRERG
ncbi:MAG TPA: polysaccharide deacetylase family protein [Kineosporiaceae bacterium]|nr:polysaccharide deacetylase family protein [Kineosporiaceae bacterium]